MVDERQIIEILAARKAAAAAELQVWYLLERVFRELKKKAEDREMPKRRWDRFCAWAKGAGRAYAGYLTTAKVNKISVRQIELALGECASMVLETYKSQIRRDWHDQDGGNQIFKFQVVTSAIDELVQALEKEGEIVANDK